MSNFFLFDNKHNSKFIQAHSIGLNIEKNDIDDHWNLIKGNFEHIHFPVSFKQEYGKKLVDVLGTGWPSLYLISEKFKRILTKNQLIGWKVFPINLYDKKNNEIKGYHGLSITGRSGVIRYDKSKVIEKQKVAHGPVCKYYKGIIIDEWDGSDFFLSQKTYHIFTTKKAVDAIKQNSIANINLECVEDHLTPAHYVDAATTCQS